MLHHFLIQVTKRPLPKAVYPLPFYPTRIFALLYLVVVHQDELENPPIDFAGFVFHESTKVVCEQKTPAGFQKRNYRSSHIHLQ